MKANWNLVQTPTHIEEVARVKKGDVLWCRDHWEEVKTNPIQVPSKLCLTDQGVYVTIPKGLKSNKCFPLGDTRFYNSEYNKSWFAAGYIDAHPLKKTQTTMRLRDMYYESGKFCRSWIALFREVNFYTFGTTGRTVRVPKRYPEIKPDLEDLSPESITDYLYGYLIYALRSSKSESERTKLKFKNIPPAFPALLFRLMNMYFLYDKDGNVRLSYSSLGTFLNYLPNENILKIEAYKYIRSAKRSGILRSQIIRQEDTIGWWIPDMTPDINGFSTDERENDIWGYTTSKNKISRHFFYQFDDEEKYIT